jgi:hypothetical protein
MYSTSEVIMKRRYLLIAGLFSFSTIVTAWFSVAIAQSKSIKPFQPKTDDEKAIIAMVAERNQAQANPEIVTRLVIVEQYGLYAWLVGEHSGGQTLVQKDAKGNWRIVRGTGGMFDAAILTKTFKVPTAIAKVLIAQMDAQIKADRL